MSYELVLDYLRTSKDYYEVNGVRIYPEERIILLEEDGYYVVLQAQTTDAWRKLIEIAKTDPSYIRRIVEYLETASDTVVPGTITCMRIRKEDVRVE